MPALHLCAQHFDRTNLRTFIQVQRAIVCQLAHPSVLPASAVSARRTWLFSVVSRHTRSSLAPHPSLVHVGFFARCWRIAAYLTLKPAHQNKPPSTSTSINTPLVQHFSSSPANTAPLELGFYLLPEYLRHKAPRRLFPHPTRHFTVAVASHTACLVRLHLRARHQTLPISPLHASSRVGPASFVAFGLISVHFASSWDRG